MGCELSCREGFGIAPEGQLQQTRIAQLVQLLGRCLDPLRQRPAALVRDGVVLAAAAGALPPLPQVTRLGKPLRLRLELGVGDAEEAPDRRSHDLLQVVWGGLAGSLHEPEHHI